MNSNWPKVIDDFELFLAKAGLICQQREELPSFGDKVLQYANGSIAVRVCSDRYAWFVEIADIVGRPGQWYDTALLRDMLAGQGEDVLSLPVQIEFVETNWPAIVGSFNAMQREATHTRLVSLRNERVKRLFPDFF